MRVTVVINRFVELRPRQTTALLAASLLRRGHTVALTEVAQFDSLEESNTKFVPAIALKQPTSLQESNEATAAVVQQVREGAGKCMAGEPQYTSQRLQPQDVILIRTNPGRDTQRKRMHDRFLQQATKLEAEGMHVVNSPQNLTRMANKVVLEQLDPRFRPRSVVSGNQNRIESFIRSLNRPCVLKPLVGSRGLGVVRLDPAERDLAEKIRQAVSRQAVIVQEFVSSSTPGDVRIVVLHGRVLELGGHVAAIERRPASGEFRANLHAGGTPHPATVTPTMREAAHHAAELLLANKIWLAGIDLVGDKIIEMNVFSTGGLFDAQRFTGQDFCAEIARWLEAFR